MTRKSLWAPWRSPYITGARKTGKGSRCIFCEKARSKADARNLLIVRGRYAYCLLNLFPYNNGHALVVPYRHVRDLSALREPEWLDLWRLASDILQRMKKVLSPQGFNLGINLGRAAGAGIPGHLHLHVVPRWIGDTNFMPILTDTRVISQSLDSAQRLLADAGKPGRKRRVRRRS